MCYKSVVLGFLDHQSIRYISCNAGDPVKTILTMLCKYQCMIFVIALNGVCLPSVPISVQSTTISLECQWFDFELRFSPTLVWLHRSCMALAASMVTTGCRMALLMLHICVHSFCH